ncbi:MAG: glycoside hydrolase [Candidatus Omnitrophica bacterium]|nr:glycoside hydrolase [Candidatus Omnitrophota bacterium]
MSKDQGKTWQNSSLVPGSVNGNEGQLAELGDNRILFDFRQEKTEARGVSFSEDGGFTWASVSYGQKVTLVPWGLKSFVWGQKTWLAWTGPKGPGRNNLVIRLSSDNGKTHSEEYLIFPGPAAYSQLEDISGQ